MDRDVKFFILQRNINMLDITDIREFIDQMRNEEGYVGILLWGSRSTETADTDS